VSAVDHEAGLSFDRPAAKPSPKPKSVAIRAGRVHCEGMKGDRVEIVIDAGTEVSPTLSDSVNALPSLACTGRCPALPTPLELAFSEFLGGCGGSGACLAPFVGRCRGLVSDGAL
jgi:hypothetical protein